MPGAASEARKFALVHRDACDDRARAGRTGPGGEDFGGHGGMGEWWIFARTERCGARGLADRGAGGEGKGREREREGFGGGGLGLFGRKRAR